MELQKKNKKTLQENTDNRFEEMKRFNEERRTHMQFIAERNEQKEKNRMFGKK